MSKKLVGMRGKGEKKGFAKGMAKKDSSSGLEQLERNHLMAKEEQLERDHLTAKMEARRVVPSLHTIPFRVKLTDNDEDYMPIRAHLTDAGFDLKARVICAGGGELDRYCLRPAHAVLVKTGVRLELHPGWKALVTPRSGMALKNGITIVNSPGLIDASYRGEIGVILMNLGSNDFNIARLDRIAQLQIETVPFINLIVTEEDLIETSRGEGGFGSTGTGKEKTDDSVHLPL